MKDGKLKSKDFFNVSENPLITFKSTKIVQTGPTTFDVPGPLPYVAFLNPRP
jgi:polyisoprenoid-binding protein YceI